MDFPCTCFTVILFYLTSIVVQSSSELIVLRSPEDDAKGTERMLTCYSKDDDSALVWNYETSSKDDIADNFEPKKSGPRINTTCAIWNSTKCMASWEKSFSWELVNSKKKPTGPVLDYRWEGFDEFVFKETEVDLKYMELEGMEESSRTLVFSVRAFRDFDVFLCHEKDVTRGRCFWIRIGYSGGKQSKILSCDRGVPKSNDSKADRDCTDIKDAWHETTVIDGYEWRTFRIEWKSEEQTIKLFNETEVDPFLQGTMKQWHSVSYVFMRSRIPSRVRFHFYDYHLTRKRDAELSTGQFDSGSKDFCVELLVGLCPNCQLKVHLVDENGQNLAVKSISGDKSLPDTVPLSWKPIHLIASLKTPIPKLVQLKIATILDDKKVEGQWAVDSFRLCKSYGSLRKSTMVIHKDKMSPVSWPKVKCQKLSYNKGAVVDSLSRGTIDGNTSKFTMLVRNSLAIDSYTSLGRKWSICNPTGCTCDRGYNGEDCEKECDPGFYGYNCCEQCGSCNSGYCDKTDGRCTSGCQIDVLLPPMCKDRLSEVETSSSDIVVRSHQDSEGCDVTEPYYAKIEKKIAKPYDGSFVTPYFPFTFGKLEPHNENKPTVHKTSGGIILRTRTVRSVQSAPGKVRNLHVLHISDTSVTLQWTVPSNVNEIIAKYSVSIKRIKLLACEDLGQPTPAQDNIRAEVKDTTASFSGLNPYANYTASVIAHTTEPGIKESIEFQTCERDIPTSSVRNLELTDNQRRLKWDKPNDCLKITGSTKFTRLDYTSINNLTNIRITAYDYLDVYKLNLAPFTFYEVRAYVFRNNTGSVNFSLYQEKNWTTAPSAPSVVKSLVFYDADPDANSISIRWVPPHPANGEIESYHVNLWDGGRSKEFTISASQGKEACELWENYVCMKNLPLQADAQKLISVKIYARNKDVEAAGISSFIQLYPTFDYNKAPGKPSNLTATHEGQGDVIFTWMHPLVSSTKITRFEITINILHSVLLEELNTRYPMTEEYAITENQKYYNYMVTLHPSTIYTVSVVAVNRRNQKSEAITTELLVPTSIGFANERKPEVTFDGTLIDVIIPKIVNTTLNTTMKVIVKGLSTCTPNHPQESSPSVNQAKSVTEWDAAVYPVGNGTPESMKIYTEQNHGVTSICSLDLEGAYTIVFNVTDWYSGFSISTTTSPIAEKSSLAWLAVLPVVPAVCMLVAFIWYRNRKTLPKQLREPSYVEPIPASLTTTTTVPTLPPTYQTTQVLKPSIPRRPSYLEIIPPSSTITLTNNSIALDRLKISSHPKSAENQSTEPLYALPNEPDSCSVSIEDFDKYAKNAASSKLLYSQFKRLQVGLTSPCEYGKLPENIPKNRSLNLIAYDDTRVILEKIPGDPYSDYINATYIKGYKKERAYIAAQGPTSNTVNDFWRMVWEQKVRVMCMLTNVTEGTETKCEKYWPDVGARTKRGDFLISNIDEQVFADYTFRTFELNSEREIRKVTHLHYTGWPSLGVPKNHQSLVAYLRKLEQTPTGNGPILVHCSTGDDRTGTVILCDICLRQAVAEKTINVMAVAARMRNSRANMVGTLQQYVLAHIIITEISVSWPSQISCNDVLSSRMNILRSRLPSDILRLKDTVWQQQALRSSALPGPLTSEHLTDGSVDKIYDDVFEEERNQIHAVSVDGVKVNKQNLACWLPSPLTLPDFWEFVAERNIKLIITLQCSDPGNPSCYDIIPDESIVLPMLQIEMKNRTSLDNEEYFTRDEFLLFNTSEENDRSQTVTVLTCRGWGCGMVQKPPDPPALISLWKASERIPRKEGQTLVLCHDSITGCGLYLALSFLLERMTVERECDVIAAVRAVRRSKPEYVQSMEQIEYLYDAAVNYVESFQTYANFR